MTAIMRNDCRGKLLLLCVVRIRMRVLSLHIGKAAFPAWIRADSWLPALPTASPWATALGWWTPRRPPTAWRPIWWTAQQVTLAALCFWGLSSPFPLLLLGWYHWACRSNSSSRIIWWKGGNAASLLPGYSLHLLRLEDYIAFHVNCFYSFCVCVLRGHISSVIGDCLQSIYTKLFLSLGIIRSIGRFRGKVYLHLIVVEINI